MATRIARALFAATVAATAAIAACSYEPNPESGKLMCGPSSSCPENYSCMNQYCWRDGDTTGAAGSGGGGGGAGGRGGAGDASAKFIGRWNFVTPTAKRVTVCPAASVNQTDPLPVDATDYITITAGTTSPLVAHYYCFWNVDLNAAGTATVLRAGQSCMDTDTSVPPFTYTWTGESFTLTTSDGVSGTIQASIPYVYTSTAGGGTCTATFSGPVMKN
jgi:hypothetical protein